MSLFNMTPFGLGTATTENTLPIDDQRNSLFGDASEGALGSSTAGFGSDGASSQFPGASSFGGLFGGGGGASQIGGLSSMLPGLYAAITSAISQYFQSIGASPDRSQQAASDPEVPQQQRYTNVNASSTGDPHDALSGTTSEGDDVNRHWDNMQSHHNLLSSHSFTGGFHVASDVGPAGANGATMNKNVSIDSNFGRNQISFNADGTAGVSEDGIPQHLQVGQTLNLSGGTSVTKQANGLVINENGAQGAALTTTLTANGGGGVDLRSSGQNVELGGYLAHGDAQARFI